MKTCISLLALVAIAGIAFADGTPAATHCVSDGYFNACDNCGFDAHGEMNPGCYNEKMSAARTCVVSLYPEAALAYAAGNCTEINACANTLENCRNYFSNGTDRADCVNGAVLGCFVQADECMDNAAKVCEQRSGIPHGTLSFCSSFLLILAGVGGVFLVRKR